MLGMATRRRSAPQNSQNDTPSEFGLPHAEQFKLNPFLVFALAFRKATRGFRGHSPAIFAPKKRGASCPYSWERWL